VPGGYHAEIREGCGKISEERNAPEKTWNAAFWKSGQRGAGEKPEAGDRHWALRSAQKGRKSPQEEIVAQTNCLSARGLLYFTARRVLRYGIKTKAIFVAMAANLIILRRSSLLRCLAEARRCFQKA